MSFVLWRLVYATDCWPLRRRVVIDNDIVGSLYYTSCPAKVDLGTKCSFARTEFRRTNDFGDLIAGRDQC